MIFYAETDYGFMWGAANVTRITSNEREGWVIISIMTKRELIEIQIMKGGKIKILDRGKLRKREE